MATFQPFPNADISYASSDVAEALAGFIARDSDGLPIAGMLGAGPSVTAVAASWQVRVGRFTHVRRVSNGIELSGVSAPENVDVVNSVAIPAGQARIDLVCWNPLDSELSVIQGAPAVSPTAPVVALPLVSVASVRVNAGDGSVVNGQIAPAFATTALAAAQQDEAQGGILAHAAGGSTLSGTIFTSTTYSVTFGKPFEQVPRLSLTAVASTAQVAQWAQAFEITALGFKFRIISINLPPRAGTLHWDAVPA